ncbi:MAG: hypothetical protein ACE5ES_00355 [Candidatus Nanoarchaeia archaeon]
MKKIKEDELIHVKLEFQEALNSKRDTLSTEMHLLQITRVMRNYKDLRIKELNLKIKLLNKIKILKKEFSNLQKNLPKLSSIEEFKQEQEDERDLKIKSKTKSKDLESELQEIQSRLHAIQNL